MKKIAFVVLSASLFSLSCLASDTDLLIWQIDLEQSWVYEPQLLDGTFPGFNKINFWLQSGDKRINLEKFTYTATTDGISSTPGSTFITEGIYSEAGLTGVYATKVADYGDDVYGGYEVMMQLWNNDTLVAVSDNLFDSSKHLYLSDLVRTTFTSDMDPSSMFASINQLGGHVVPEPTSGLLMMLGAGLLALRRRRRA